MTILRPEHLELLDGARRAALATIASNGLPRQVPICFAVVVAAGHPVIYSALDEKPKRTTDPRALARVRDLVDRPIVSLLADRWAEDWRLLAWLRVEAVAGLLEPGGQEHERAVDALRARYPQYGSQALETLPLLRLEPTRAVWWSASPPRGRTGADPG